MSSKRNLLSMLYRNVQLSLQNRGNRNRGARDMSFQENLKNIIQEIKEDERNADYTNRGIPFHDLSGVRL